MTTVIRPEVSEKNQYWISKHRHYELKHFCLQYPLWKQVCNDEIELGASTITLDQVVRGNYISDSTSRQAIKRAECAKNMKLVESAAIEADEHLHTYLLRAVTEGLSYNYLKTKLNIPCGKDMYYSRYRRFFWLLSNARN